MERSDCNPAEQTHCCPRLPDRKIHSLGKNLFTRSRIKQTKSAHIKYTFQIHKLSSTLRYAHKTLSSALHNSCGWILNAKNTMVKNTLSSIMWQIFWATTLKCWISLWLLKAEDQASNPKFWPPHREASLWSHCTETHLSTWLHWLLPSSQWGVHGSSQFAKIKSLSSQA